MEQTNINIFNLSQLSEIINNDTNTDVNSQSYDKAELVGFEVEDKIESYMYGLNKVIPWDENNFIWSGGLLYDTVTNRIDDKEFLADIDLFFYGNAISKINTFKILLSNLDSNGYEYMVGINKSVVYIFIQGIPRIIQLIFTNKSEPSEIIDSFDLTHLQSYWDGNSLYCKKTTLEQYNTGKTLANFKVKPSRLIKFLKRNVDVDELLYSDYDFVFDKKQFYEYNKNKKQKDVYLRTNNLTKKYSDDVNNNLYDYSIELYICFWCKIITIDRLKNVLELNLFEFSNPKELKEKLSNNLDKLIDYMGDIQEYSKMDLEGKFEPIPYELDLCDDIIQPKSANKSKLTYDSQMYIYVPCQVIKKLHPDYGVGNYTYTLFFEFTKPRVIDYLTGLIDDIEQDVEQYLNPLKKQNFSYKFTHHFVNSTSYPEISQNKFFIQTGGLVYKCKVNETEYNQCNLGNVLFILFNIDIYNMMMIGQENMFGFSLKPIEINKLN